MSTLGLVVLGVGGLVAGSLATMGVHRLADPTVTFWRPPPRCPTCTEGVAARDLIPVISWVARRGRCRSCGEPIGVAYPVVELMTAGLFVLAGRQRPDLVELVPLLLLIWTLVVASVTDLYVYLIPNRLLFPALAASIAVMVPLALADDVDRLGQAALGLVLYSLLLFVPHLIHPAGMGMGDVKLSLLLGLHLGYLATGTLSTVRMVVVAMLVGSLLGVLGGVSLLLVRRAGWDPLPDPLADQAGPAGEEAVNGDRGASAGFPFGPPLSIGTLAVALFPAAFGLA